MTRNNQKSVIQRYRVVALGRRAALIVDRLRSKKRYGGIRFVYCNTDSDELKDSGWKGDERILLTDIAKCRNAIRGDKERMVVLVSSLGNDFTYKNLSWKYAAEIMAELSSHSERSYCFVSIPFWAGGQRNSGMEVFNQLTDRGNIIVLQDDLKAPYRYSFGYIDEGLGSLLEMVLQPMRHGRRKKCRGRPFGVWATEKQVLTALLAKYSNNMPEYYKEGTFSFHK